MNDTDRVDYRSVITMEPGKLGGKPCIRGLRISVYDLMEYLAGGMSVDQLLVEFPALTREDVLATFAYLADVDSRIAHAT